MNHNRKKRFSEYEIRTLRDLAISGKLNEASLRFMNQVSGNNRSMQNCRNKILRMKAEDHELYMALGQRFRWPEELEEYLLKMVVAGASDEAIAEEIKLIGYPVCPEQVRSKIGNMKANMLKGPIDDQQFRNRTVGRRSSISHKKLNFIINKKAKYNLTWDECTEWLDILSDVTITAKALSSKASEFIKNQLKEKKEKS